MLYGIIADIHGNLEALQQVLTGLQGVDQIICLGDIVGYGPAPSECLELIQNNNIISIAGNHDMAAIGEKETTHFNKNAKAAIEWTAAQLTEADRLFLASLPVTLTLPGFQIVHGSLRQPLEEYLFTLTDALTCFTLMKEPLLFVGHTHKPAIAFQTPTVVDGQRLEDNQPVKIDSYEKVIINVGSVGQPRDGDPRASFGVYHQESRQFALKRVEYNIPAVQADMRQKNLPTFLIERLSSGK